MRSGAEPGWSTGTSNRRRVKALRSTSAPCRERRRPETSDTSGGAERTRHGYEPTGEREAQLAALSGL